MIDANGTYAMSKAVPTGDCNTCHKLNGYKDALGRIMAS